MIVEQAVAHLLPLHCSASLVAGSAGMLDAALVPAVAAASGDAAVAADGATLSVRAMEGAADRLGKQLKSLDEVRPGVVGIQPVGAALRGTALFPPHPHPLAGGPPSRGDDVVGRCLAPVELLVQLEGSGA